MSACRTQLVGFTLIEVLLALVLSALVLTTVSGLTRQILLSQESVQRANLETLRTRALVDTLRRDLHRLLTTGQHHCIQLNASPRLMLQLICLSRVEVPDATLSVYHPMRVTYRLEPMEDEKGGLRFVRESHDLTQKRKRSAAGRKIIARNLHTLRVRLHANGVWHDRWPVTRQEMDMPRFVEVHFAWRDRPSVIRRRVLRLGLEHG